MFSTTARVILLTYKIMSLVNPLRMKTNMIPTACKNLWDWALIIALSPFPMALLHHHAGLLLWLKPYQVPFALDPVPAFPCACEAFLLSAPWLSFISVKSQRNSFQTTLFEIALTPTPFPSFLLCFLQTTYSLMIRSLFYYFMWPSQCFLPFAPWGQRVSFLVSPVPRTVSDILWGLSKYLLNKWLKKWDAFN